MSNPLADATPPEPSPDQRPTEPRSADDIMLLLAHADWDEAWRIAVAIDQVAIAGQTGNETVLLALAILFAKLLAIVPMGDARTWTVARFAEMTQVMLPVVELPAEEARRRFHGLRKHDA